MKRVLVAPLDWGLGHATRCVPIVRELLRTSCEVYLAGSGASSRLLRNEFPELKFFWLPGYHPVYPATGSMTWKMALQVPKFMRVIRNEHDEIEAIVRAHQIDLVISDNRFGCWSSLIPSVFITHQRNILLPVGFKWLETWVNRINDSLIRKFSCCWIPDRPEPFSLAGRLATASTREESYPTRYIGNLSRFGAPSPQSVRFDIVCILSGPEPQRSIFEERLVPQLRSSGLRYFIVRGLIEGATPRADVNSADFLSGGELQQVIEQSACVISRSGYSTVMDLAKLGRKAIFVPTPGQTEQEYLAASLMERKTAFAMNQQEFDLMVAWNEQKNYAGFERSEDHSSLLRDALDQVLSNSTPDPAELEFRVRDNTLA